MDNRPDLRFRMIHENIRVHFDYLFQRDFRIVSTIFLGKDTESWLVTMLAGDWFIKIHYVQEKVEIGITTLRLIDKIGFLDLGTILEYMGKGDDIYNAETIYWDEQKQIESMAQLLRKYLNGILTQFDGLNPIILDRVFSNSPYNVNGQLSMDNCP